MALINIEYGSLASSETMNTNFQYLDNRISTVVENSAGTSAVINSNIASLSSSLSLLSGNINTSISDINNSISSINGYLSTCGLYIETYVNGSSWYREYFSDSTKTTRVWIEQGGIAWTNSWTTLLQEMSNANYTLVLGRQSAYMEAEGQEGGKTTTSFYLSNGKGWGYTVSYYVCGI